MASEVIEEKPASIIPMLQSDMVGVFMLGGAIGLLVLGVASLLNQYVFGAYFCQSGSGGGCTNAGNYAAIIAGLIGSIIALGGLLRLRVYRPLLVVIASMASVWGIVQMSWELSWFTGLFAVFILYALAFGVFSWIARVREFWMTLILMIALVVVVRLALAL